MRALHFLGGPTQLKRICRRMEGLRWASVRDRLGIYPLSPDSERDRRYNLMMGVRDEYLDCWAPSNFSAEPFTETLPEPAGRVLRYPAQIDTDDYFASTRPSPQSSEEGMEDGMQLSD